MRDIFVSYSSKDRAFAQRVVAALEQRGWSVWLDVQIPPGRQYDEVIVDVLRSVKCVVVLWSSASGESMWVKNEAAEAMGRRNLIPATIEPGVAIPFEFRRLQAADLSRWTGDPAAPEFEQFCDAIAPLVAGGARPSTEPVEPPNRPPMPPPPPPPIPVPTPPSAKPSGLRNKVLVGTAVVVACLVVAGLMQEHADAPAMQPPAPVAATAELPGAGAQTTSPLAWRDRSLRYTGTVTWDPRATDARIHLRVFDGQTARVLAETTLPATVRLDAPGRYVFTSQVQIAADSETPYPHPHNLNLVFEMRGGRLTLVRNCTAPNDCYEVGT